MPAEQLIHIHPQAPAKPAWGQPCNGCGVCCLAEPCPIGVVVSRRRRGACDALVWSTSQGRYLCGVLDAALRRQAAAAVRTGWLGAMRRVWTGLWARWVRRHIASGLGCDASFETQAQEQRQ